MAVIERHTSPDRVLTLLVDLAEDGDWSVGFAGSAWHTHSDLLTSDYGGTPETAVRDFVREILSSKRVIVISRIDGKIREAWVTDDPSHNEMKYALPNESIEKRYWDGRTAE